MQKMPSRASMSTSYQSLKVTLMITALLSPLSRIACGFLGTRSFDLLVWLKAVDIIKQVNLAVIPR